jgi:hypothetical protein
MTGSHEWFPFHEDESVAAAIGALLTGVSSLHEATTQYDVPSELVVNAIHELGLTEHVDADFPIETSVSSRELPKFLRDREPVTREQSGVRERPSSDMTSSTYDISFPRAVFSEACKCAQEQVSNHIRDILGTDAADLRVATRAIPTDREFPDHVRWITVEYLVDDSGPESPAKVSTPSFPFERLENALPRTVDAAVDVEGETFVVRNIPVIATKEHWT